MLNFAIFSPNFWEKIKSNNQQYVFVFDNKTNSTSFNIFKKKLTEM